MTDKAVSQLTALTGANVATGDLLYIVDISEAAAADRSKKITAQEIQNYLKKFPATIGVGNATPAASGAGISFPATASASSDANTLDDYEEGSFTPTISSTAGSVTLSTAVGTYTKVGRQVTINANVVVSASTASSNVALASLPFASASNSAGSIYGYLFSADVGTPMVYINSGETEAVIQHTNGSGSVSTIGPELQATTVIYFSLTYFV